MKRIGVLTSGGDAPGMNPALRAIVRTASGRGVEVLGFSRGYAGLCEGDARPLAARDVGGIIQRGGTVLMTERFPSFQDESVRRQATEQLQAHAVEGLVIIGGSGTQRGALALSEMGVPVLGVPSTIDNDLWGTDICLGVDTALNTIVEAVDRIRDTASSYERAFIVEVMGRDTGYLALMAGIAAGAEMIVIPEMPLPLEEMARRLEEAYARGKHYAILMVAEGAPHDVYGIARHLEEQGISYEVRVTVLGHVQRGGRASAFDRILATRLGARAVEELLAGNHGLMVGLHGREIGTVPLAAVAHRRKALDRHAVELGVMVAI